MGESKNLIPKARKYKQVYSLNHDKLFNQMNYISYEFKLCISKLKLKVKPSKSPHSHSLELHVNTQYCAFLQFMVMTRRAK